MKWRWRGGRAEKWKASSISSSPLLGPMILEHTTRVLAENIKPDHAPDMTQTIAELYHALKTTKAFYFLHLLFESPPIYLRTSFM